MEAKYESAIKVVLNSAEVIFDRVTNFAAIGSVLPQDKIKNWNATADTCTFTVDGAGDMGLAIVEKNPFEMVKYGPYGQTRFNFNVWIQIKQLGPYDSRIKVTLKADLNPMMKMMVGKYMQKFVDGIADGIARAI